MPYFISTCGNSVCDFDYLENHSQEMDFEKYCRDKGGDPSWRCELFGMWSEDIVRRVLGIEFDSDDFQSTMQSIYEDWEKDDFTPSPERVIDSFVAYHVYIEYIRHILRDYMMNGDANPSFSDLRQRWPLVTWSKFSDADFRDWKSCYGGLSPSYMIETGTATGYLYEFLCEESISLSDLCQVEGEDFFEFARSNFPQYAAHYGL